MIVSGCFPLFLRRILMSSIYDWSLQAADNANADNSINWAEGQPPSSVNNSARTMMQRLREFLADIGGNIAAGGTSALVTVTSNSPVRSYSGGLIIRFRATLANSAGAALSLNNLAAKPILKAGLNAAVPLEGGEMQPGGVYECVYNAAIAAGGAWFLLSPAFIPPAPPSVPAGFVAPFCGASAPTGWLKCNGSFIARADYADLYQAIGDRFGRDDKGLAFRLPDLRGEFIRGWVDDRTDIAMQNGRALGAWERAMLESHRHSGATDWGGGHSHQYLLPINTRANGGNSVDSRTRNNSVETTGGDGCHSHHFETDWGVNDNNRLGGETRPQNVALLYCIKY